MRAGGTTGPRESAASHCHSCCALLARRVKLSQKRASKTVKWDCLLGVSGTNRPKALHTGGLFCYKPAGFQFPYRPRGARIPRPRGARIKERRAAKAWSSSEGCQGRVQTLRAHGSIHRMRPACRWSTSEARFKRNLGEITPISSRDFGQNVAEVVSPPVRRACSAGRD